MNKKKVLLWSLVGLGVLVLAGGVAVGVYVLRGSPKQEVKQDTPVTTTNDQPATIKEAEQFISDSNDALAKHDFATSRDKLNQARTLYEKAGNEMKVTDIDDLLRIVNDQEEAYNKNVITEPSLKNT